MRIDFGWLLWVGIFTVASCSGCKSSATAEAEEAARRYMEKSVVKCGDSYYMMSSRFVTERRGFTWSVVQNPSKELTESEKLNRKAAGKETQWEGTIAIECSAARNFNRYGGYWDPWMDNLCHASPANVFFLDDKRTINLVKQDGVWLYDQDPLEKVPKALACQNIPPG